MATHSRILAWRILMDRGHGWVTVRGVTKMNITEQPSNHLPSYISYVCLCFLFLLFFFFFTGETGPLFQKDTSIFRIKTVMLPVFLPLNWSPKRSHQRREHFKPTKLPDVHLTDLTETSPKNGALGRERNFKRLAPCQPTDCRELSQPDGVASVPQPQRSKISK